VDVETVDKNAFKSCNEQTC